MSAGAKPALDSLNENKKEAAATTDVKPLTLKDRILHVLSQIFEHNERLGSTRQ
jgi:hypothetical protein